MSKTIVVDTIQKDSEAVGRDASGIAAAYFRYDQDTPTISKSLNISSISDDGTGKATTNFTSAFTDAVYSYVSNPADTSGNYFYSGSDVYYSTPTTSAHGQRSVSHGNALEDCNNNSTHVMGDLA